jgi:hypothetical protein
MNKPRAAKRRGARRFASQPENVLGFNNDRLAQSKQEEAIKLLGPVFFPSSLP